MPHDITPTDSGDVTAVTVPSDGDAADAASVEVSLQAVANLAAYLRGLLTGTRDGDGIINLVNALLTNPTLGGTIVAQAPILGQTGHLYISQTGETTHILGDGTVSGTLKARVLRHGIAGATTDHSYSAADAGVIAADPTAGDITYTLLHAGALQDDEIHISVCNASDTTHQIIVCDELVPSTLLMPRHLRKAAGFNVCGTFKYDATIGWACIGWGVF